jgi:hypothetical protein
VSVCHRVHDIAWYIAGVAALTLPSVQVTFTNGRSEVIFPVEFSAEVANMGTVIRHQVTR